MGGRGVDVMGYEASRVLITGGAGFIGVNLAAYLVEKGAYVTVLDNFSSGTTQNLSAIEDQMETLWVDVRDRAEVEEAVKDKEYVFHLAANASVPKSVENPRYDIETNTLGTLNILEAVRNSRQEPTVVYASTAAVYGEPEKVPIPEDHPKKPVSLYGVSKLSAEHLCEVYHKIYGLRTISLRYFNVYGPMQPRYIHHDLVSKLLRDPSHLEVLGDGNQERDWIYVSDCVSITAGIAQIPSARGEAYNLATGKGEKVRELVEVLLRVLGLTEKTKLSYTGSSWKGDIVRLTADISKIRALGFEPKVSLREGVFRYLEWYDKTLGLPFGILPHPPVRSKF